MCRKLIISGKVNAYSFYDSHFPRTPLRVPLVRRGVNVPRLWCEFTLECLVFCIGMVLVCLEGPYFILTSLVEVQMTTLPPPHPRRPTALIINARIDRLITKKAEGFTDTVLR